ncbi:PREDICTED: acid-sensing ion channel 1-like [Thamnophis sirtalis]|uniref:Acid-sensing ion channel 1-like n=1 Tax=Thamnophis sirtalis TaxID=35019 RepID=A0A6I9XHZ7_9SAUR|nr:PREDICTED: acid-sensing ion channel 1-like [Thamnophis sirtalis]
MMDLKVDEEEVENGHPVSIETFASSSTLHGLSHIFSYERLSVKRIFWTLCFLGSLAVLVFVCNERIQYYFRYPHVTKLDEVAASHMTFPAITFCNLNEFRFSRVTKNDLYHAGELLALLNSRLCALDPDFVSSPLVSLKRLISLGQDQAYWYGHINDSSG